MENALPLARAVLAAAPARWVSLAEMVPAELLSRKPAAGEWSALECLQHLIDTERAVFPVRVEAILAGRDFPGFDPDTQGTVPATAQPALALAQEFARLRGLSLNVLAKVTDTDLTRRGRHQELGPVTMSELLSEWAAHDLMHMMQAERAMMQPFIAGCGPWQPYFAEHVIRGV